MPESGCVKDLGIRASRYRTNWVAQLHAFEERGLIPQVRQLSNGSVYFQGIERTEEKHAIGSLRKKLSISAVAVAIAGLVGLGMFAFNPAVTHSKARQTQAVTQSTVMQKNPQMNCEFNESTLEQLLNEHPKCRVIEQIRIGDVRQLKLSGFCERKSYLVTLRVVDAGDSARIEKVAYSTE